MHARKLSATNSSNPSSEELSLRPQNMDQRRDRPNSRKFCLVRQAISAAFLSKLVRQGNPNAMLSASENSFGSESRMERSPRMTKLQHSFSLTVRFRENNFLLR